MPPLADPQNQNQTDDQLDNVWNVVVQNDPVNLMSYVTYIFEIVFHLPKNKAEQHMWEVHSKGRSILWSGNREEAELYTQQLHAHLLLASLEKSA